ncbi:MAG: chemotaxis protein CheW [Bacteroidota bacterium]
MTQERNTYLSFTLEDNQYALAVDAVQRVVRAVHITELPKVPNVVHGIINFEGKVIPVCNARSRFHLPAREIALSDQFIIARIPKRTVALAVDATTGLIELSDNLIVPSEKILPNIEYIKGVIKLESGLHLIHDLEQFLSLEEEAQLDEAMKTASFPENNDQS